MTCGAEDEEAQNMVERTAVWIYSNVVNGVYHKHKLRVCTIGRRQGLLFSAYQAEKTVTRPHGQQSTAPLLSCRARDDPPTGHRGVVAKYHTTPRHHGNHNSYGEKRPQ